MKMSEARTRIILWRHGETDWNRDARFQGQADIPLNAVGHAQAARAAEVLVHTQVDALYASPLRRAQSTAQALAHRAGLAIHLDDRLQEIHVGSWEGRTIAEVKQENPDFADALASGHDFRRSPEGETSVESGARMGAALLEIAAAHRGQTVVVASHGLSIRMSTAHLLGWDYPTAIRLAGVPNCAWSTLGRLGGSGWRLLGWNQAVVPSGD